MCLKKKETISNIQLSQAQRTSLTVFVKMSFTWVNIVPPFSVQKEAEGNFHNFSPLLSTFLNPL